MPFYFLLKGGEIAEMRHLIFSSIFFLQMKNLDSIILFPVDRLLKTELRGSKGDLKRPFDRAWKEYHDKFSELERQKKKAAKEAGQWLQTL
jgi:Arf-GAP/SH3 domain/ANK repeat/PH domain-containing protein